MGRTSFAQGAYRGPPACYVAGKAGLEDNNSPPRTGVGQSASGAAGGASSKAGSAPSVSGNAPQAQTKHDNNSAGGGEASAGEGGGGEGGGGEK